ncbi:unnamed protein product [Calypogeia fissa]
MENITHKILEVNGIRIRIAELGSGPLVVLVHGFPQLWYAWRHQMLFLAEAGYHCVALDLRGQGQSDIPTDVSEYTYLHHAGDIIGVIDALGEKQIEILMLCRKFLMLCAYLVGHDWGSVMVSWVTLFRPDLVKGLVNLSVPFVPRNPTVDPLTAIRAAVGNNVYMNRWQSSAEVEAEADFSKQGTKTVFQKILFYNSAEIPTSKNGKTVLESIDLPDPMPTWLTDEDIQYYVDSFNKTGFTGGFNFYRNYIRTWELTGSWSNKGINTPNLFVVRDRDLCYTMTQGYFQTPAFKHFVPNLKDLVVLPGVSHFLAEEVPDKINPLILKFLKEN